MLNNAEISEESFETKLDVSNTVSDLCPLPVCENAAVYLSSFHLAHETFNGNWSSIGLFYTATVCLNPPWEPPDDRTRRKFKFMSVLVSKNDEIKIINEEDLCIGLEKAEAKQGGFGSYLLGLNKRRYEAAGVNTEGSVPRSYKEPAFGWMTGFLFVTTFVGLLALVPLRKIMIIDYKLTYPSGTATTILINSFHTEKGDKMTKKQVKGFVRFFSMSLLGSFFQWFFSGAQSTCGFSLFPTFGLKAFIQTFYFDFSMAYVEDEMKNASMLDGDDLADVDFDLDIYSDLVLSKPSDVPEEEVSFSHMRNDFSSQSVLNETEVVGWKEIQGIAKSVRVPSCSIRNAHKVFDMLLMVNAESKMFDKGVEVVDYREENGIEIDERACMVLLLALKRADQVDMSLKFFRRMVDANVPITMYSMAIAVDGLCRKGETNQARVLIDDMSCLGFKANAYSYNTLICAYINKGDFVGVDEMLKLMKSENVDKNAGTYTILMEGYASFGKFVVAESLFEEMCKKGVEAETYAYISIISWNCKMGRIKRASALFDEMVGKGLEPTATTFGALINGACKAGQVEAAYVLVGMMQSRGVDMNKVIFNTLIGEYCKKGMIDKAMSVRHIMVNKGFEADVYTCNTIVSTYKQYEEAKSILFHMVGNGIGHNTVSLTTLIDKHCKQGNFVDARIVLREMDKGAMKPIRNTNNASGAGPSHNYPQIMPGNYSLTRHRGPFHREVFVPTSRNGGPMILYERCRLMPGDISGPNRPLSESFMIKDQSAREGLLEEAVAVSAISVRISKFVIFSSPRPPEGAYLEDKVNFKEGVMLRVKEVLVMWENIKGQGGARCRGLILAKMQLRGTSYNWGRTTGRRIIRGPPGDVAWHHWRKNNNPAATCRASIAHISV